MPVKSEMRTRSIPTGGRGRLPSAIGGSSRLNTTTGAVQVSIVVLMLAGSRATKRPLDENQDY